MFHSFLTVNQHSFPVCSFKCVVQYFKKYIFRTIAGYINICMITHYFNKNFLILAFVSKVSYSKLSLMSKTISFVSGVRKRIDLFLNLKYRFTEHFCDR